MAKSNKGAAFEREVVKLLSLWASGGETDDWFWRSSQSGGRATQRAKSGKRTINAYGDVSPTCYEAGWFTDYFCLELKRGYTNKTNVLTIVDSKRKNHALLEFWEQCERDRVEAGRAASMVIFRRDRCRACVMVSLKTVQRIKRVCGSYNKSDFIRVTLQDPDVSLVIFPFTLFFEWITPAAIIEAALDATVEKSVQRRRRRRRTT